MEVKLGILPPLYCRGNDEIAQGKYHVCFLVIQSVPEVAIAIYTLQHTLFNLVKIYMHQQYITARTVSMDGVHILLPSAARPSMGIRISASVNIYN
jgi:hypothetical protein